VRQKQAADRKRGAGGKKTGRAHENVRSVVGQTMSDLVLNGDDDLDTSFIKKPVCNACGAAPVASRPCSKCRTSRSNAYRAEGEAQGAQEERDSEDTQCAETITCRRGAAAQR
jgi:hypothetical protein